MEPGGAVLLVCGTGAHWSGPCVHQLQAQDICQPPASCWDHHVPTAAMRNPFSRCPIIVSSPSAFRVFWAPGLGIQWLPTGASPALKPSAALGSLAPTVCQDSRLPTLSECSLRALVRVAWQ